MRLLPCRVFLLVLPLLFLFPLRTTAAPGSLDYSRFFVIDGSINFKSVTGDRSSPGFHQKTAIHGGGRMDRLERVLFNPGSLRLGSAGSWEAAPDSPGLKEVSVTVVNADPPPGSARGTGQVFAVSVEAEPGFRGSLNRQVAASDGSLAIDQEALTGGGVIKRRIDLVCPVSGVYLFEDSTIEGSAFFADSLRAGDDELIPLPLPGGVDISSVPVEATLPGEEETAVFDVHAGRVTVPPGTAMDEAGLPPTVSFALGSLVFLDIPVTWDVDSEPAYDPGSEGEYLFTGAMDLPADVVGKYRIYFTVTVDAGAEIPEPDPAGLPEVPGIDGYLTAGEGESSDHLENAVDGGEHGVDDQADDDAHG